MEQQYIQTLIQKYIDGTATPEEETELTQWYRNANDSEREWPDDREGTRLRMLARINEATEARIKPIRRKWLPYVAAASILVAAGCFFLLRQKQDVQPIAQNQVIRPGSNGAILTLAGGKKIVLEQTKTGLIARQGGATLQKAGDSLLTYSAQNAGLVTAYNTLETPYGRQFEVVLSDGTEVWLNAASTLRYPAAFSGPARKVELSGEAYFKVSHDAAHPFLVETQGQEIRDIGTEFDVNAYSDEPATKTTLISGRVNVNGQPLIPGQQAAFTNGKLSIASADTEEATAWKDGYFRFDDADMQTIMRQFRRWYDIQVVYDGPMQPHQFQGRISRRTSLDKVLNILKTGGVKFKTEGRKLIVTP